MLSIKLLFLTLCLSIITGANAQKNYQLDSKPSFTVFGTSTLHDWEMKSNSGNGSAIFSITDSKLTAIDGITVALQTESIKSGKSTMDKIAYETLKTDKYKIIKYVLKSATKLDESTWNLLGIYTIAGVSKEMKTQVKVSVIKEMIFMQGTNTITFADFGMTPPTALFGTIKTGKELVIKFNINFK